MNKKSRFVALMICGLILFALILREGSLFLLTLPLLAYLLIGIMQAPTGLALSAERLIDNTRVTPSEPAATRLTINNMGDALINIYIDDPAFPSMSIMEGQNCQRLSLPAGETTELHYVVKAGRRAYTWRSIQAVASDSFELFELRKEIPAPGELIVRSVPINVDHISLRPGATLHTPGPISIRLSGSSTDFLGIREYRSGDSLRRLNWRLAARHPHELFTNEKKLPISG